MEKKLFFTEEEIGQFFGADKLSKFLEHLSKIEKAKIRKIELIERAKNSEKEILSVFTPLEGKYFFCKPHGVNLIYYLKQIENDLYDISVFMDVIEFDRDEKVLRIYSERDSFSKLLDNVYNPWKGNCEILNPNLDIKSAHKLYNEFLNELEAEKEE